MQAETLNIQKFDIATAGDKQWDDYTTLARLYFEERKPGEPLPPEEHIRKEIEVENQSERNQIDAWLVYDDAGEEAIAYSQVFRLAPPADDYESKKHVAHYFIYVKKDHRRKGIGRQLLQTIATDLQADNRTIMESWVAVDDGNAFMEAQGAKIVLQMQTNRLYLSDVDWEMVELWAQEGQERNPDTELFLSGDLPSDEDLQNYVDLIMDIFAQMPKEDASGFPEIISVEEEKERHERVQKQGYTILTAFTREKDGTISAMTDADFSDAMPHLVFQGLTGVHVEQRGRGLGKWLKAAMLLKIRENYPDAQYIDTNNANVNAPMLHINDILGFKFYKQNRTYALQVEDVLNS